MQQDHAQMRQDINEIRASINRLLQAQGLPVVAPPPPPAAVVVAPPPPVAVAVEALVNEEE